MGVVFVPSGGQKGSIMCNSRIFAIWLSFGLAFGGVWIAVPALAREWTDNTGKYKIEADFVSAENGVVTLKKSDGQTIHLPLEKLSEADRQFVRAQAAAPAGDNPFAGDSSLRSTHKSSGAKGSAVGSRPAGAASLPLPKGVDAVAVRQAEEGINDLFKSELAEAKTSSKRADLAKQLLQTGKDTKDDLASQFVLFRKAAELAATGGDVETALAAVEELETVFRMDAQPLAVEVLEISSRQAKVDHRALAKRAEPLIDKSLAADDFDAAAKLATIMVNSARSAKDLSQLKAATARVAEIGALREEQKKIAPAREKLETTPSDPEANRIVGRYLCFEKRDWEHGIPMLSLGDDESLKKIAGQELKDNKTGNEMTALGDCWDALSHGRHGAAATERADYWYRQALPLVSGVAKLKLEKRLAASTGTGAEAGGATGSGTTNSIAMKLVRIPAGEFDMGEDETLNSLETAFPHLVREKISGLMPLHHVRITKPYYIGAYTVTVKQFRAFINDQHYRTDAERDGDADGWDARRGEFAQNRLFNWQNPGYAQTDEFPVVEVSWDDAVAFCDWLSKKEKKTYRLPTSAEWEYACRAGTKTRFYFGDDPEKMVEYGNVLDAAGAAMLPTLGGAIKGNDGYAFAAPVGRFKPNPWGLYDMHGNVAQFCRDFSDERFRAGEIVVDPKGPETGFYHVARGAGWQHSAVYSRSASMTVVVPKIKLATIGFRVVCEAE